MLRVIAGAVLLWLALLSTSCVSTLMARRNAQVVDEVVTLQKKTDLFLIKLERLCGTPAGEYTKSTAFYDEVKADASSLQVRIDAIPRNRQTSGIVALLLKDYENLEKLHKTGCVPEAFESARTLLNVHFTSLLTLEEAKESPASTPKP